MCMNRNLYDPTSCSWYRLNIDITQAIIPGFFIQSSGLSGGFQVWEFLPQEILNDTWLAELPWTVTRVLVFARTSDQIDTMAHIDNQCANPRVDDWSYLPASINWCIGENYTHMQWWSAANTLDHTPELHTMDQGSYVVWPLTELELIDQCRIGGCPTLIRTDQPHSIAAGAGTRISISLRLAPWSVEWPRIVSAFAPWIRV